MKTLKQMVVLYYGLCGLSGFVVLPLVLAYFLATQIIAAGQTGQYLIIVPNVIAVIILSDLTLMVLVPMKNAFVQTWQRFN